MKLQIRCRTTENELNVLMEEIEISVKVGKDKLEALKLLKFTAQIVYLFMNLSKILIQTIQKMIN